MDCHLDALSESLSGKLGGPISDVDLWAAQEVGPGHHASQIDLQGFNCC